MRITLYLLIICLLACSCKSTQQSTSSNAGKGTVSVADGSSMAKAIKVSNIREEYEWAKAHCPGCQFMSQALLFDNKKKPFDALTYKAPDGAKKEFYFDISSFFGKF